MTYLYCDRCERYIQKQISGVEYKAPYQVSVGYTHTRSLCSRYCVDRYLDEMDSAGERSALDLYVWGRNKWWAHDVPATIDVQEYVGP